MKILMAISPLFLLLACAKNKAEFNGKDCAGNCYILTGKVNDTPANAGLQGVELKFYWRPPGAVIFFDPTRYLGKTTTDANGNYKFQFDGSNYKTSNGYYWITATKNGYIYDPVRENRVINFDLDSTQFGKPVQQSFSLFRYARLIVKVQAKNVTNFDFLTITYNYGTSGYGIVLNGHRQIDTTINYVTGGDVRTFVNWNAIGNGVRIEKADTLFTNAGGTLQYQVNL